MSVCVKHDLNKRTCSLVHLFFYCPNSTKLMEIMTNIVYGQCMKANTYSTKLQNKKKSYCI